MKVVQSKPEKPGKKPQIPMWVPAWVKNELGFKPGDEPIWFIGEDDDGKKFGGVFRRARGEKAEGGEKEGGEEKKGEEEV